MKKLIIIMAVVLSAALAGCSGQSQTQQEDGRIKVAVSVVPEAAFVEAVAGDLVDIVTVIPTGYSPANYQPTTVEMQAISDADIYFVMQVPTEEANILPKIDDFNKELIMVNLRDAVSAEYPLRYITDHGHDDEDAEEEEHGDEQAIDPHIWLSVKRAEVMVQVIADELSALDETNREVYQANAAQYIQKLSELDTEIAGIVSTMDNKTFMIYHGSYGYFADDYGLSMISLESDGKAATAARMQEVIDMATEQGITSVFYQDEFDDNQARTIAEEIGGTVVEAAPLSADYINELRNFAEALSNGE